MVVKILSSAASFKGVSYNTTKVDRGKGELMKVSGFGPVEALESPRPEDYKNYLQTLSKRNTRVKAPQFHAVISAKGKEYDKVALTAIATEWLATMGYEKQPYLIVYHNDTDNAHVHMVSARIDKNGKKISDSFENNRAVHNLNKVLGLDEQHSAKQDIVNALTYNFSTKAQFLMILESKGYAIRGNEVIKFGKVQELLEPLLIGQQIAKYIPATNRKMQLKALFHKYARVYDTTLNPGRSGSFTSEFSKYLKEKHGLVLLFHAKDGKPPYGYSILDHSGKGVFKGTEVVSLQQLLSVPAGKTYIVEDEPTPERDSSAETKTYYAALLKAALYNYPDFVQGLHHQGLSIMRNGDDYTLADKGAKIFIPVDELLDGPDYNYLVGQFSRSVEVEVDREYGDIPGINIADDIDDEAINGRNRNRKKQARTNTR
jgi:hypothetical protein